MPTAAPRPFALRRLPCPAGRLLPFGISAVLVAFMPQGARAQEIGSSAAQYLVTPSWRQALETWDNLNLNGAARVADRGRGEYEPLGIRLPGGHMVLPSVGLMAIHDDNIFRKPAAGRTRDTSFELTPSLVFLSQFPRHMLNAEASGRMAWFQDHGELDVIDGKGLVNWRVDIDSGNVVGGSVLSRIAHDSDFTAEGPIDAAEPVRLQENIAELGFLHDAGRLSLMAGADFRTSDYSDVRAGDGSMIDQDERDNSILGAYLRLNYRVSPGYTAFAAIRYERQEFWDPGATDLNGNLYKAEIGVDAEINPLLRVGLSGGYAFNDIDAAAAGDGSGYIMRGRLQWLPTELMTISLEGAHEITQSTLAGTGGSTRDKILAHVDYDVFHNAQAYVEGGYQRQEFIGQTGIEEFIHAGVGIEYFMNRHVSLSAGYEYRQRNNTADTKDYEDNRFILGVKIAQ